MSKAYLYVLLEDGDRTMRSQPEPIGFAVKDEEQAKEWAARGRYRTYRAIEVVDTIPERWY